MASINNTRGDEKLPPIFHLHNFAAQSTQMKYSPLVLLMVINLFIDYDGEGSEQYYTF